MPTQIDFTRVNTHMIEPLSRLYGGELNTFQIEGIVEDLQGYSVDILQAAFKQLRQTSKRMPTIAHMIEACNSHKPRPAESAGIPRFTETNYYDSAEMIMKTAFGQMALKEGWANSLFVEAKRSGKLDWSSDDAERLRAGHKRGIEAAYEAEKQKHDPLMVSCVKIYRAMQEKEKKLFTKYYQEAA